VDEVSAPKGGPGGRKVAKIGNSSSPDRNPVEGKPIQVLLTEESLYPKRKPPKQDAERGNKHGAIVSQKNTSTHQEFPEEKIIEDRLPEEEEGTFKEKKKGISRGYQFSASHGGKGSVQWEERKSHFEGREDQ